MRTGFCRDGSVCFEIVCILRRDWYAWLSRPTILASELSLFRLSWLNLLECQGLGWPGLREFLAHSESVWVADLQHDACIVCASPQPPLQYRTAPAIPFSSIDPGLWLDGMFMIV